MLLPIGHALAHGTDHITGLANAHTDLAALVADHDDGAEAHLLAAFDGLGDPADLHHPLLPFGVALLAAAVVAPASAATAATAITTAATAVAAAATLLLAFSAGRNADGRGGHVAGSGLFVGFGHGWRRFRTEGPLPGRHRLGP